MITTILKEVDLICIDLQLSMFMNLDGILKPKGESQRPAGNIIVSVELLTTVANSSKLLPAFTFEGEG
jgi:hypothetical protein